MMFEQDEFYEQGEFYGNDGCQVCRGDSQTFRMSFDVGMIKVCAEHREALDLAMIYTAERRNLQIAHANLRACELLAGNCPDDRRDLDRQNIAAAIMTMHTASNGMFRKAMAWIADEREKIDELRAQRAERT